MLTWQWWQTFIYQVKVREVCTRTDGKQRVLFFHSKQNRGKHVFLYLQNRETLHCVPMVPYGSSYNANLQMIQYLKLLRDFLQSSVMCNNDCASANVYCSFVFMQTWLVQVSKGTLYPKCLKSNSINLGTGKGSKISIGCARLPTLRILRIWADNGFILTS